MVIAALVSFGALLAAWLVVPAERRAKAEVRKAGSVEVLPRAA
jgi:hypothetical protein